MRQVILGTTALATNQLFSSSHNYNLPGLFYDSENTVPCPTNAQLNWQNCEIGIIYHFDISVAVGRHEAGNNSFKETFDPKKYNPTKLDTDQWIKAAKAVGAKYAIFTATHFNGFLQWQSNAYPYGLKQAKWRNGKGDIVADFVNSCHKAGIMPGIYLSTHRNAYWQLWDYYVGWGNGKGTKKQKIFNRAAEQMVKELCSNYGPLVQIWFDAGTKLPHEGGPDVLSVFEKYQPDSVFYHATKRSDHRWIGNEAGYANYPCWSTMPEGDNVSHKAASWKPILADGDPKGKVWSPGMVDVPFRAEHGIHNWFWAPNQDHSIYSKEKLLDIYYTSVGRNCNLVIGEVITPEGLVPEADISRLKEFGDEIRRRFSKPIAQTSERGKEINLNLPGSSILNHVVIQEDIAKGERIRKYIVEGLINGKWEKICDGESVGYKRIQQFEPINASGVRLKITDSIAEPLIKNFSVYLIN